MNAQVESTKPRVDEPSPWPEEIVASLQLAQPLRYGENPHQPAALYTLAHPHPHSLVRAEVLGGKELSYNNLLDLDAALHVVRRQERSQRRA